MLWLGWNLAVVVGVFVGTGIPEGWSLGFTIPLSFLALLLPSLRDRPKIGAALAAGLLAVLCIDLPFNAGLMVASIGGVLTGVVLERLGGVAQQDATQPAAAREDA